MNEKLLVILLQWRDRLRAQNIPSPPESDLRLIAASNRTWPTSSLSGVTEAWRETIQYLEKQQRFGVVDPLAHMADDMWAVPAGLVSAAGAQATPAPSEPARAEGGPPPASSTVPNDNDDDAAVAALTAWLDQLPPGSIGQFPEARIRSIVTTSDANRSKALASFGLSAWEAEINAVIARARGANGAADELPRSAVVADPPRMDPTPSESMPSGAGTTAVPAAAGSPPEGPLLGIDPDRFAPYDFSVSGPEPGPLTAVVTAGKSLQLSWSKPESGAAVNLYRIVADDAAEPWSPESGRLVGVTGELGIEDIEPFSSAVRHVQVWCNSGATVREAQLAQPICIAKKAVVCPVLDVSIREEAGTVTGEWDVPDGVECVQVYRVPVDKAQQGSLSPIYRIQADEDNLGGFQDVEAERGKRYLYQFVAEAEFDGMRLTSTPVTRDQQISVVLTQVNDLSVQLFADGNESYFDISWTPPSAGRVTVYRSSRPPAAGIEDEVQDEARLAGANLVEEDRLRPVRRNVEPGRDGMRRVPWPEQWARAYFTPVTTHNGRVLVGRTVAQTRVPDVRDARVVERVNEQLLTFTWPPGAASVYVYVTRRNTPADSLDFASMSHQYEISYDTWETQGGFHFVPPLHLDGCALHLVAVAFQQGQSFRSRPYTVDYPGLRVLRYNLEFRRNRLVLRMSSDTPAQMPEIRFALICNGDRFPLDIKDGIPIPLAIADADDAEPQPTVTPRWSSDGSADVHWTADMAGISGRYFIRMFADLPPERLTRIALLDPAIESLLLERQ